MQFLSFIKIDNKGFIYTVSFDCLKRYFYKDEIVDYFQWRIMRLKGCFVKNWKMAMKWMKLRDTLVLVSQTRDINSTCKLMPLVLNFV